MSHTANSDFLSEKGEVLHHSVAQCAAVANIPDSKCTSKSLRDAIKATWPALDTTDLDHLIEYAERLANGKRSVEQ